MSSNLSLTTGLARVNTSFIAQWGEMMALRLAGVYQLYTQEFVGGDVKARTIDWSWAGRTPLLRKWMGSRQSQSLRVFSHSVTLEPWEATLRLNRMDVEYDPAGVVDQTIGGFVQANRPDRAYDRVSQQLFDSGTNGVGPVGYDGVPLFDAAHPFGPSAAPTQGNLGAGTNLSAASLRAARSAGMLLRHENGEPADINYDVLRVGPLLLDRATELLGPNRIQSISTAGVPDATSSVVGGSTIQNTMSGAMKLVVDHRRTNFYADLIDSQQEAKPMFMYIGRNLEQTSLLGMGDMPRVENNEFVWLLDADLGVTAGHYLTCYRLTGTA
jgi:phage major head subunit gpT-like protein